MTEGISVSRGQGQSTQLSLDMPSQKTCRDGSVPKTTLLDASSVQSWERMPHSFSQEGNGGQTRVWLLDQNEQQRGEFSTLNTSASPNDAEGCSLSAVLETGPIPQRYYLSAKACQGILRRAEKRGKSLPPMLEAALRSVAGK
jgi:hypothetical protein